MSESRSPAGGRYQRSSGGLVGAMVVTVLAVLAIVAVRGLNGDNEATPVRAVDYAAMERAGRADGKLLVMAPPTLPAGWKATSATYETGSTPTWHLGMLTDDDKYVGVEEALGGVESLVKEHVDADAEQGRDVTIGGETWQSWSDPGGDYAVSRSLQRDGTTYESWIVVGTAPQGEIRDFAATLEGGDLPAAE
ncbi:MAG: DUF4245 domain-containing protein [Marmoricola sp.]